MNIVNKLDELSRNEYPNPIKRLHYLNQNIPKMMDCQNTNLSNNVDMRLFRGYASELIMTNILEVVKLYCNVQVKEGLLIPISNGTTQLDHFILTPTHGIVIEVKHVYGNIDIDGTNMVVSNDNEVRKMTPWNQNLYHICKLKEFLGLNNLFFYNAVFIYGDYNIKGFNPVKGNILLQYDTAVRDIINLINSKPEYKPNKKDILLAVKKINNLKNYSILNHISNVRK